MAVLRSLLIAGALSASSAAFALPNAASAQTTTSTDPATTTTAPPDTTTTAPADTTTTAPPDTTTSVPAPTTTTTPPGPAAVELVGDQAQGFWLFIGLGALVMGIVLVKTLWGR